MKKSSRLSLKLLITTALILGPTACLFYGSGSCPDTLPYFKITGLRIYNYGFVETDNRPVSLESGGHVTAWDQFFLKVGFDQSFHASTKSFCQANLYALSCDEDGSGGSKTGLDTLYLITMKNYNEEFTANDTINSIIEISNGWTSSVDDLTTDFDVLANYVQQNDEWIHYPHLNLRLTSPPFESEGDYQFKLVYILDDGEIFTKETAIVKLKQ